MHVSSPDGGIEVFFRLTDEGIPQYRVMQDGAPVIEWSAMGLVTAEQDLTQGFRVLRTERSSFSDRWETVWGEERWITVVRVGS